MRIYSTQNRGRRGNEHMQGRIQDFKLWGAHLKKLRRAEGGAKIFGAFRVKKSRLYAKKSYFLTILGGAPAPSPWIRPLIW